MPDAKELPAGQVRLGGKIYMPHRSGSMVPLETVRPEHILQDDVVRSIFPKAEAASADLKAFMAAARREVNTFLELVLEKHGAKARPGGDLGNMSLNSYDGLLMVKVQVAKLISFDSAALAACKALIEECIAEWSADSNAEIRAIVMNAFRLDNAGQINRGALLGLFKYPFTDERWLRAMDALREAIEVTGTKDFLRFYKRAHLKAPWVAVSLDAATV